MATSFTIDTSDMERLARDLVEVGVALEAVIPIALEAGAQVAAETARGLSSWSTRIPRSIRVTSVGKTALVRAGGPNAPHAAIYEHGGKHPTFGHRPFVSVAARPFLAPATVVGEEATEKAALAETDRVLRSRRL